MRRLEGLAASREVLVIRSERPISVIERDGLTGVR
jgi:hypothetical protein